jgi:hypothetical protein
VRQVALISTSTPLSPFQTYSLHKLPPKDVRGPWPERDHHDPAVMSLSDKESPISTSYSFKPLATAIGVHQARAFRSPSRRSMTVWLEHICMHIVTADCHLEKRLDCDGTTYGRWAFPSPLSNFIHSWGRIYPAAEELKQMRDLD